MLASGTNWDNFPTYTLVSMTDWELLFKGNRIVGQDESINLIDYIPTCVPIIVDTVYAYDTEVEELVMRGAEWPAAMSLADLKLLLGEE